MKTKYLIVITLLLSSCVSRAKYLRDLALTQQLSQAQCESRMMLKDQRLRKFNQLNEDGSLRYEISR